MSSFTISAERKKEGGPSSMVVFLTPDGRITVQDYSHQDDRHELVRRLQKMGVETKTIFDSLCG